MILEIFYMNDGEYKSMDFSEALKMMKNGTKICRSDWDRDIDEYLFLNDDGVIEYYNRFTTSSEPDIVDAEDVVAMDWEVYEDFIGRVFKAYNGNHGIITRRTDTGYSILLSYGKTTYYHFSEGYVTNWECPAIKKALEQLKSIEEREDK